MQISDSEPEITLNTMRNTIERFNGLSTSPPRPPRALSATSLGSPDEQQRSSFGTATRENPTPLLLPRHSATPRLGVNLVEISEAERPWLPLDHKRQASLAAKHGEIEPQDRASDPATPESTTTSLLQATPAPGIFPGKSSDYATRSAVDITDLTKTVFQSDYLCSHCKTFSFDDFSAAGNVNKV
jgi:hypothetical protein